MQILFADGVAESKLAALRDSGHEVVVEPDLGADDLPGRIPGVDILVVRSTKVTAATFASADRLGLVVRAGAGVDNIDRDAASAAGVYVCNVPGRNALAVAELTMGLLLSIDRRIADNVADLRAGTWNKKLYSKADGLYGRRMAIIGLGDIGLAVAERARGFGMTVTGLANASRSWSASDRIDRAGIELVPDMATLLGDANVVSLHVPRADSTVGMVDAEFLAQMRDGAILLNTSRGEVVDNDALIAAMDARGIRAGLDVYAGEPGTGKGDFDSALARHPNVVGTHHIGASTEQAQESVVDGTVEVIEAFINGDVQNCVNLVREPKGTSCLTIRHHDRVGVLAHVFELLREGGMSVKQMQNQLFSGGEAAVATINVDGLPSAALVERIEASDDIIGVAIVPTS